MTKIRILIASDHHISRLGLQSILAAEQQVDIIGTSTLGEALRKMKAEAPDVMLLHVAQVGARAVSVARDLAASKQGCVVLVMNTPPHEGILASLLRTGVVGFVVTRSHPSELVRAARAAAHGRRYIDAVLNECIIEALLRDELQLSAREQQVVHGLALGLTQREISARLGISIKTVETYRRRLSEKLNLRSRSEIVQFAISMGMLRVDGTEDANLPETNEP